MTTLMRLLIVAATALLLAACGGGGGCAGTVNGTNTCASTSGGAGGTTTTAPAVARFVYTLDKNTINDSGTDAATLTITALDASNNVISGITINVSVSSGTWTYTNKTTDASGNVVGKVAAAGDKSNRTITVNFTDGNGTVGTAAVLVTGATMSLTVTPTTPNVGQLVTVAVKAADVNSNGAAGVPVQVSLSGGSYSGTLTTDASGQASVAVTAPATAGTYTWTATGLGVTQTATMQVGSASAIPNVTATIASANLAINPVTIAPNTAASTASQAQLRALFTDNANQPIPNVRVRFELDPAYSAPFSTGESISTGTNNVYSDATGVALSAYVAGLAASSTNGVHIRACYGPTDASIAGGLCPNQAVATLTVASAPVSITIGSNNLLAKDGTGTIYTQTLVVVVNDAAGVAVSGAYVSGSVDITHYGKGYHWGDPYYVTISGVQQVLLTPPTDGQPGVNATDLPSSGDYTVSPIVRGKRVWCANEDYNRNAILETTLSPAPPVSQYPTASEDVNGNGILDPRKADVTIAFPNGHLTDSNGQLVIKVSWPMNVATWEAYTVTASTSVSGTQGIAKQAFETNFIKGDETNGSFNTPPYGVGNCTDPL